MAERPEEQEQVSHPYRGYERYRAWAVLDHALEELVDNKDLKETTRREYIVGWICKALDEAGLLVPPTP